MGREFVLHFKKKWPALILAIVLLGVTGCLGRGTVVPQPFESPRDSRLILHVPYIAEGTGFYSQAALAAVMTFNGRPLSLEEIGQTSGRRALTPLIMARRARGAGLKAEFYNGAPEELVEAVRTERLLIVRMGLDAGPLKSGNYVVVVGYTPGGMVVNSTDVNQQIVDWSAFLTAWLQADYFILKIEPF